MMNDWIGPVAFYLGQGFLTTLGISALSIAVATPVGVAVGALSLSANPLVVLASRLYVEILRGVPSLIILLFVFFALPRVGIETGPVAASVIGLGLWSSANIAESARGALGSIASEQGLSARALGMTARQAMVWVILPQAVRRFLPSYVGQLTILIQASTLTSIVGLTELLGSARQMIERLAYVDGNSHAVLLYAAVLAAFFVVCYPLTILSAFLEKRNR